MDLYQVNYGEKKLDMIWKDRRVGTKRVVTTYVTSDLTRFFG